MPHHIDDTNEKYELQREQQIASWIEKGAKREVAEQLWDDMVNDPHHSDPDMTTYFDPTIDDRIKLYS